MRLTGGSEEERLDEVCVYLTRSELGDLFEALRLLVEKGHEGEWHHHVGGPSEALTLALEENRGTSAAEEADADDLPVGVEE